MRATVLLGLVLFITTAWAGGYQGVLERVMLYFAYEIDGLNPKEDRVIGFACKGQYNTNTNTCLGTWVEPNPKTAHTRRANINELLGPLSKLAGNSRVPIGRDSGGNPIPLTDGASGIDPEQTAKYLYPKILKATESTEFPEGRITNPPPFKMMKGGTDDFANFLSTVGKLVQKTSKQGDNYENHKALFQDFQKVNTQILNARIGDHGAFQIEAIKEKLAGTGIEVKTKTVGGGTNPVTGSPWETVDWKKTISDGVADTGKSTQQVTKIVEAAAEDLYTKNAAAKDHKTVIDVYRRTDQRMNHCGVV